MVVKTYTVRRTKLDKAASTNDDDYVTVGTTTDASSTSLKYTASGLTAGKSYFFQVKANTTSYGSTAWNTATTFVSKAPPNNVTGFTQTGFAATSVALTWNKSTNNGDTAKYAIQYRMKNDVATAWVAVTGAGALEFDKTKTMGTFT